MSHSNHRVVVVDYDARIGERLRAAFQPPEFDFYWFADGREALDNLRELRPHVIICDLMLPGIDGREVLDAVKRSPDLRSVPFVILSGVRSEATIQATLEAGAHAFLLKPYPVSQLVDTIRKVLEETPQLEMGPARTEPVGSVGGTLQVDRDQELGLLPPGSLALPVARRVPPKKSPAEPDWRAPPPAAAGTVSQPLDEGRISRLDLDGGRVEVKTGAVSGQNLVILTTVTRDGKELWKAETTWSRQDAQSLKELINHQHAGAVEEVRRLPSQAGRPPVRQEQALGAPPDNATQPLHARGPGGDVDQQAAREPDRAPGDAAQAPVPESSRVEAPGRPRPGKRRSGKQAPPPPIGLDAAEQAHPPPIAPDAAQQAPHAPIALDSVELEHTAVAGKPSLPEPGPPADSPRPQGWPQLLWKHAFRGIGVLLALGVLFLLLEGPSDVPSGGSTPDASPETSAPPMPLDSAEADAPEPTPLPETPRATVPNAARAASTQAAEDPGPPRSRPSQEGVDRMVRGRRQWAEALYEAGRYDEARVALREVFKLSPEDPEARRLVVQIERAAQQDVDDAPGEPLDAAEGTQRPAVSSQPASETAVLAGLDAAPQRDMQAVLALLGRYETALEHQDMATLKSVWPNVDEGNLRARWQVLRSWSMTLRLIDLQIAGDAATALCESSDELLTVAGERAQTSSRVRFALRREHGSWVIDAVQ